MINVTDGYMTHAARQRSVRYRYLPKAEKQGTAYPRDWRTD